MFRTLHPDIVGEPAGILVNTWVHMAWERLVTRWDVWGILVISRVGLLPNANFNSTNFNSTNQ